MRDFMIRSGLKVPIPAIATPAWTRFCQYRAADGLVRVYNGSSIPSQYRRRHPSKRISWRRHCYHVQVSQQFSQSHGRRRRGRKGSEGKKG